MRIFKHAKFSQFAVQERINDVTLRDAVQRILDGSFDAALGGGVYKQRIAREEQGKSKGFRSIIVMVKDEKAFFVYAFAKSEKANITLKEKQAFKLLAKGLRMMNDSQLQKMLQDKIYIEIQGDDEHD
jgi:hypothetical protein